MIILMQRTVDMLISQGRDDILHQYNNPELRELYTETKQTIKYFVI